MRYNVWFTKHFSYIVDADDESTAINIAKGEYRNEIEDFAFNSNYDEINIWECEDYLQSAIQHNKTNYKKLKDANKTSILTPATAITEKYYTRKEVACLLAELFGEVCPCDFSSINEYLPEKCDFGETICPDVSSVDCWEQYLKYKE